jgi:hypothetical protein
MEELTGQGMWEIWVALPRPESAAGRHAGGWEPRRAVNLVRSWRLRNEDEALEKRGGGIMTSVFHRTMGAFLQRRHWLD